MTTAEPTNRVLHRNISGRSSDDISSPELKNGPDENLRLWHKHVQKLKGRILAQVQDQLGEIVDRELSESVPTLIQSQPHQNGRKAQTLISSTERKDGGKVFMHRMSLLDELFEVNHIRAIYHMFLAIFLLFCLSTLTVDYLEHGSALIRLVLKFDLLFYAFGKLGTVACAWTLMFLYTLLVPYQLLVSWGSLYHSSTSKVSLSLGFGLVLCTLQSCVLGLFPVYVVVHNQLPPASRFIVILEQIRFLMKTYSFIRESVPLIINNTPKEGENPRFPTFSSYLYFLFCPTLIYREAYPRNSHIRWNYVGVTLGMILTCLFYGYYILERLCVPAFRPDTDQSFSKRSMVLAIFHSIFPGTMLLLLCFFAFLHCWLNLFAELMCFADRMFYKDWWNSYSFANYYRTWNVVVHDFLYYYGYRDLLWLSRRKFRTAAMLSVFMVSAFVHEYALGLGFGFFYPVMFFLFAIFGVLFNFAMNDKRQSPICNVVLWASLFLGQGVQVCLYCQEWYAQIHCPPKGDSFWELVTPRSWSCTYYK